MGCCDSKLSDEQLARKLQTQYDNHGGGGYGSGQGGGQGTRSSGGAFTGQGQVLGTGATAGAASPGASTEDRRAAAAAAAEARSQGFQQGGSGSANKEKAKKMADRRTKDELVGKIEAHYATKGEDPPFGLPGASLEVLRKHLDEVKGR